MNPKGVAAIVTGGGTGIGGATAEALAKDGAKCALLGRRADVVEAHAKKIGGIGIQCDVTDPKSTTRAIAAAREAHGPARILVNSAGWGPLGETTLLPDGSPLPLDKFRHVVDVNLFGPFDMIRQCAADMAKMDPLEDGERGVIINILSAAAHDGPGFTPAYVASKGGLGAMTLALAREFGTLGIRVLAISPGTIRSPMAEAEVPAEMMEAATQMIPFPKIWAEPSVVGDLIAHMVGNTFLNGEIVRVDGGARVPYQVVGSSG